MAARQRVLVVTNMYPSAAGPTDGIFIARQIAALREASPAAEFKVRHLDTTRLKLRYLYGWALVLKDILFFGPTVVHVHYGLSLIFYPPPLSLFLPCVVTLHGSDLTIPWQRRITNLLFPSRARLIAVSPSLLAFLPSGASKRAQVLACGVNAEQFAKAPSAALAAAIGLAADQKLVLFGANPGRQVKCYPLFQAAQALLQERGASYRFATLADFAPGDVPAAVRAASVLVLTSLREGSPVVTKEALCAGTRVVSVDVGDVAVQLEGFEGVAVVHERSGLAVAAAIEAVLAAPAPDAALAARRFDIGNEVSVLRGLYKILTGDRF